MKKNLLRRISKKEKRKNEIIKSEISDTLWEHKKKIKYSQINELYKGKNESLHICILSKYKNKDYEDDKTQIFIILSFENYTMELFKFENKKQYKDIEVDNDIKEMQRKKSEYYDLGKETTEDKDTDLILFEKFSIFDILSLNSDTKSKNVVKINIRENMKEKEKEKDKDKKKMKRLSVNFFEIVLDFSSANDSKSFISSFKKIINDCKSKNK